MNKELTGTGKQLMGSSVTMKIKVAESELPIQSTQSDMKRCMGEMLNSANSSITIRMKEIQSLPSTSSAPTKTNSKNKNRYYLTKGKWRFCLASWKGFRMILILTHDIVGKMILPYRTSPSLPM